MDMEYVIFTAIKSVLSLKKDDIERSSRSPFGLYAKINRVYGDRNLKEIIIDNDHKEVCICYEKSASAYDISGLKELGSLQVLPLKHISDDDEVDSYYLESNVQDGICLKFKY